MTGSVLMFCQTGEMRSSDFVQPLVGLVRLVKSILLKIKVKVIILGFKLIILKFLILGLILPS